MKWYNLRKEVSSLSFKCGFCSNNVASDTGYLTADYHGYVKDTYPMIRICPHCKQPTYINEQGEQFPNAIFGHDIANIPQNIENIYNEARRCIQVNAFTASVLLSRKLLMNIAVDMKAEENKNFKYYVDYLDKNNFIPPNGKKWVDYIRKQGNEATHEIIGKDEDSAKRLIKFIEMLLRVIYEFPSIIEDNQ